jgi:hypothetical protein
VGATNSSEAAFRSAYNVPQTVPVVLAPFDLRNEGESVALLKPNDPPTNAPIVVDRLRYNDKGLWPSEADGAGPSLERVSPNAYGNESFHWRTSLNGPTPGRVNEGKSFICISRGSRWKIHGEGRNLGAAWQMDDYSDSGWPTGRAPLGTGQSSATVLNVPLPITTYLRKEFVLADEPASLTNVTLEARYDDGFVAYLNGQEIARRSMPGGAVNAFTPAEAHAGDTFEAIDLTAARNLLRRGRNVLAVELHQQFTNDTESVWDAALVYTADANGSPAPVRITSFRMEASDFVMEWDSTEGNVYRVQASADLVHWSNLDPSVTGSGSTMEFRVSASLVEGRRFFRVLTSE